MASEGECLTLPKSSMPRTKPATASAKYAIINFRIGPVTRVTVAWRFVEMSWRLCDGLMEVV